MSDSIELKVTRRVGRNFDKPAVKKINRDDLKSESCFSIMDKYGIKDTDTVLNLKMKYG